MTVDPNEQVVTFGIITDSHIDLGVKMHRNKTVIHDINVDCGTANCLGIVHMGDMIDTHDVQQLIAFRQLYEQTYPGYHGGTITDCGPNECHDKYSAGYRINKAVFPTVGNHDISKSSNGWWPALDYVGDLIVNAPGIISHYGRVAYAWRWGRYHFIQLGLWAGDCEYESSACIDYNKLNWLKAWLREHVGDSGDGVLIFQHYGWDSWTIHDTDPKWWSDFQRQLEVNVLCRREKSDDPCNPYNVLGIFTGHNHDQDFPPVPGGWDAKGNKVSFQNIVFRDSGAEHGHWGYSIAYLDGVKLKFHTRNIGGNEWYWKEYDIRLGP
ncbi:MAG: hypothetical protein QMD01_01125 [Thermodesulfovibrionales bacterium]|nr:hypothetical protein [Thermodesulfovibrionales bacterium]